VVSYGELTDTHLIGFKMATNISIHGRPQPDGITYHEMESVEIYLGDGHDRFNVVRTQEAVHYIYLRSGNDRLQVNDTSGDFFVYGGLLSDEFYIYGLGAGTTMNVYGEQHPDNIWVDGTGGSTANAPRNNLANARLRWSGSGNDDTINIKLSSVNNTYIDLFDDNYDINDVNIDCGNVACYVLSRENFIANVHNMSDPNSTVERITLVRSGGQNTAIIHTVVLRLNGGRNQMYFDDTFAPMEVFGGPLVDGKYFVLLRKCTIFASLLILSFQQWSNVYRILCWAAVQLDTQRIV